VPLFFERHGECRNGNTIEPRDQLLAEIKGFMVIDFLVLSHDEVIVAGVAVRSKMPPASAVPERVETAFRAADLDGSGSLDAAELKALLNAAGVPRNDEQCSALLAKADLDRSGKLSLQEVGVLFDAAKLAQVFEEIDADHSGAIHASELSSALEKLGHGNLAHNPRAIRTLLAKVDSSGDGLISLDEFEAFFQFVPNASLEAVAEQLLCVAPLDVGTDLAPPLPPPDRNNNKPGTSSLLPVWECLLFGGVAGVASRTLTAPLERVKIQAQVTSLMRRRRRKRRQRSLWAQPIVSTWHFFLLRRRISQAMIC
jgi:Ca2+-binding EF-hand superfamily protein